MSDHAMEFRRQIIHLTYGPVLVLLYHFGFLNNALLLGVIIGGAMTSFLVKREKLDFIRRILGFFEREHHMRQFPGRGILFFTIGAYLCLVLFDKPIAYAGILILSVGDAFTNLVGRHLGRMTTRLNPEKFLEGTLVGIILSIPVAYYFVPNLYAAIAASCIAMFLEIPQIKIFDFEVDDNLIIPLGASLTLTLFT
ncbi:hypothetical protein JXA05_02775 [Candidatus Peregrinibacteria bacterium]|nr:hypothetical protein [Candidatus Peregrinibacteria bacterium]